MKNIKVVEKIKEVLGELDGEKKAILALIEKSKVLTKSTALSLPQQNEKYPTLPEWIISEINGILDENKVPFRIYWMKDYGILLLAAPLIYYGE